MEYKNIILEFNDCVAKLTINRPNNYNALTIETLKEISDAIDKIESDHTLKVLTITGAGEKAFVAGADIKEMTGLNNQAAYDYSLYGANIFYKLENMNKITIALINGFALGGGLELALACDLRYATHNAKFGQPEVSLGITPGYSGCIRLPRIVGLAKAKELLYSGEAIDCQEAYRINLVNQVFPVETFNNYVNLIIKKICSNSFSALINIKKAIHSSLDLSIKEAMVKEAECFANCFNHQDQKEGLSAFLEKRTPNYEGGKK